MALLVGAGCGGGDSDDDVRPAATNTAGASSGSGSSGTTATNMPKADDTPTEKTEPAPGRILVSSSAIMGQKGKLLIVFGPKSSSQVCALIDSDDWSLSET